MEGTSFKSPLSKLMKFFRRSRDGWKDKCRQAKVANKALAMQTRAVERSRERWKQEARAARKQLRRLEREVEELKRIAA